MIKVFNPCFSINIANKPKKTSKPSTNSISRKCYAVVTKIEDEYKAIINFNKDRIYIKKGDELSNEQLILPFTENSLNLKGKEYVFAKNKDEYGKHICIIRDYMTSRLSPGLSTQYDTVCENLLIAGHIIRKDGKMYFEYEDLIAFHYLSEYRINDIQIDNTKPLFNK